jgi:hypothetical protein
VLTRRGAEILTRLERTMDDVTRALAANDTPGSRAALPPPAVPQGTVASAHDRPGTPAVR